MTKEQRTYIAKRRPPNMPAGCQNSRLAGFLKNLASVQQSSSISPSRIGQAPPRLQIAEQLFDWGGGNQGRAAKKKAEGQKAKVQGKTNCISYIHESRQQAGNRLKSEYTQWVELCRLKQTLFKSNKTGKQKKED